MSLLNASARPRFSQIAYRTNKESVEFYPVIGQQDLRSSLAARFPSAIGQQPGRRALRCLLYCVDPAAWLASFVLGSVVAAIVIAAIPPAFQLATAKLESVRKEKETQQENVRKQNETQLESVRKKFNTAGYWDINKRILIGLSQLQKSFPDDAGALAALNLIKDERAIVTYGAADEERSKSRFWWGEATSSRPLLSHAWRYGQAVKARLMVKSQYKYPMLPLVIQ